MATALVNCPERLNYNVSSLRRIVIGGAASSPTLIREVEEKLGCECCFGVRADGNVPSLSISPMKLVWGGICEQRYVGQAMTGYAFPGVEIRVVDAKR